MNSQMITAYLIKEECCDCGVIFGIESGHRNHLIQSHDRFYCPNGHGQSYVGKTEAEKLQDELTRTNARLDQAKSEAEYERRQRIATKGHMTRIKNRVSNGVCPCCNRSFENLKGHMKTKHPSYAGGSNG